MITCKSSDTQLGLAELWDTYWAIVEAKSAIKAIDITCFHMLTAPYACKAAPDTRLLA
jgi:hypothetical protein